MAITAGILAQNALKKLLEFGKVSFFLGYNALEDFFPSYQLRPNPSCENKDCLNAQRNYAASKQSEEKGGLKEQGEEEKVLHEQNEWGITLVGEEKPQLEEENKESKEMKEAGVEFKYTFDTNNTPSNPIPQLQLESIDLEELQNQFNQL